MGYTGIPVDSKTAILIPNTLVDPSGFRGTQFSDPPKVPHFSKSPVRFAHDFYRWVSDCCGALPTVPQHRLLEILLLKKNKNIYFCFNCHHLRYPQFWDKLKMRKLTTQLAWRWQVVPVAEMAQSHQKLWKSRSRWTLGSKVFRDQSSLKKPQANPKQTPSQSGINREKHAQTEIQLLICCKHCASSNGQD